MLTLLKIGKVIIHIAILYVFYLFGNWILETLNLFIPGSVIGMILLFILLMTNIVNVTWVEEGARFMINDLALFFIPATVGVMDYFELFSGKGLYLVPIVLGSTALVMAGSGIVGQWLIRRKEVKHD